MAGGREVDMSSFSGVSDKKIDIIDAAENGGREVYNNIPDEGTKPKLRQDKKSVVPRKGVGKEFKIVPRKGVTLSSDVSSTSRE